MPFASERQRKAMYAAASGRGKVGIPPAAAKRFVAHSERAGRLRQDVGKRLMKKS